MEDDPNHKYRMHNPYYPFAGAAEWSLAKFLAQNLTKTQITEFLKLRWVLFVTVSTTTTLLIMMIDVVP